MSSNSRRFTTIMALFLAFAIGQVYVGVSFAGPGPAPGLSENPGMAPQQATGTLTTQGNRQITVNGTSAISGTTIVSGARIETPAAVGATVSLGILGSLDIEPNAILTLTFDQNGNVKVFLSQGCVVLHTTRNTIGVIETAEGVIATSDPTKDDVLRTCAKRGAVPGATGTAATTGMSTTTKVLIGALAAGAVTAAVIIVPCRRGRNPSPGEPRGVNDECR
jgi:hypothetical protein